MYERIWSGFVTYALFPLTLIVCTATQTFTASIFQAKNECPKITIQCPTNLVLEGETFTVSVKVEGADSQKKLTYHWSVDNGKIISGQGTTSIQARTIESYKVTKINIKVCGLEEQCPNTTWCSFIVQH